jgi:hypothetical protein
MTLNIAVFAPMPKASVSTATTVKPGFLIIMRIAYRKSRKSDSIPHSFYLYGATRRNGFPALSRTAIIRA